ncbi:hypothetical protein BD410DRAFT_795218 [Rickenella mellea]|uniref:TPR-like protein n=1 Tax=Rickenella mellea TaxID=50990 RepID=A0A4Y7PMD3_9AGAM|nr:hypothetical protein BD410DRAFT_795218 [Rickenella mellea]
MGRTRVKTKKARPVQTDATQAQAKEPPSIPSLLEKARSLVTQCDYDMAQKFVQRILERSSGHVEGKELLGVIQLEKGDINDAKLTFQSLISGPDAPQPPPPSAHLYLAQLTDDDPLLALKHYQAAVNIMFGQLKGKEPESKVTTEENEIDIRRNIVRVLVAMVEIWMAPTYDLCFDPKAEETCESLLKTAFEVDSNNVEALICLSSFRLSQQKPDEAKESATRAWFAWKDLDSDDPLVPPVPTRIELTKRFIEISDYASALLVLQSVMGTDDQDVEAWYLEGWCFFLMAEQAKETGQDVEGLSWEELAQDARDCLETCRTLHLNEDHSDKDLLGHTKELITQLESLNIKPSPDGPTGPEEEDEWEDASDDSDGDGDVEMS